MLLIKNVGNGSCCVMYDKVCADSLLLLPKSTIFSAKWQHAMFHFKTEVAGNKYSQNVTSYRWLSFWHFRRLQAPNSTATIGIWCCEIPWPDRSQRPSTEGWVWQPQFCQTRTPRWWERIGLSPCPAWSAKRGQSQHICKIKNNFRKCPMMIFPYRCIGQDPYICGGSS